MRLARCHEGVGTGKRFVNDPKGTVERNERLLESNERLDARSSIRLGLNSCG
jgi:hypothetical protein